MGELVDRIVSVEAAAGRTPCVPTTDDSMLCAPSGNVPPVGVGPKWIVRRSRVQDAAERVARGETVDWAGIAQELGYHDQAHLIRDFREQVGSTPAAYARQCGASVVDCASVVERR